MRPMKPRPGAQLLTVKAAACEYGLPEGMLRDLVHGGELRAIQPPGKRRIFIVRQDLLAKLDQWVVPTIP